MFIYCFIINCKYCLKFNGKCYKNGKNNNINNKCNL